jgi:hypothetical protein
MSLETIDLDTLSAVTGGEGETPPPAPTTGETAASLGGACLRGAAVGGAIGAGVGALTGAGAVPGAVGGAIGGCVRGMIMRPTPAY